MILWIKTPVGAASAAIREASLIGVMVSLLTGCATTAGECDPSTADFFKNTSCLASGAYGERQRAMQATLAAEQSRNDAFRAVLAELRAEQSQVSSQLGARQSDYARLDAAWRELEQSLAAETKTNRALASRIAALDSSVQARKQVDSGADLAAKQAKRDDLERKLSLLERELAAGVYE
jgi:hypothetical protein